MKTNIISAVLALAFTVLFAGCAGAPVIHTDTQYYDIPLSFRHPTNTEEGITLVAISRSGRVTIRMASTRSPNTLWRARNGEHFVNSFGAGCDFTLESANFQTGEAVIRGENRIYYVGNSPPLQ